jgi:hypothetical protein
MSTQPFTNPNNEFPVLRTPSARASVHPAKQYLNALFEKNDIVCLTFIHGTKTYASGGAVTENVFLPLSKVTTDAGIKRLTERNKEWHIYVSMAPFKPNSQNRTKANIAEVRHVFIDADENGDAVLAAVRASVAAGDIPAPTIVVQSSPHKYQCVWNVAGFTVPEQEALNRTLQQKFGTDAQAVDAARVLRIAGFCNIKPRYSDPKPVAEIVEYNEPPFLETTIDDFNIPLTAEPDNTVYPAASDAVVQQSIECLEAAMDAASVSYVRKPWDGSGGAYKFSLALCPWRALHENGGQSDAIAIVQPSGAFGFKCLHSHCSSKGWNEFRAHLESLAGHKLPFQLNGKPKSTGTVAPQIKASTAVETKPAGDPATQTTVATPAVEDVPITTVGTKDMPESVLDGWLGEICKTRMLSHFPVAYAWPALVTVASALVPVNPTTNSSRCNLYTALVGPIHSGKSEAIKHAKLLLGIQSPPLLDLLAGSAEMLTSAVADAGGQPRLYSPDELGHLLEKAQIQNSSFVYILNRAFGETGFKVRSMEKKRKEVVFNATLSIIGGIVDERFGDLYTAKTTGGFYDRGLYSSCPTDFCYEYAPFEGGPALQTHWTEGISNGDGSDGEEILLATVGNLPIPVIIDKSAFDEIHRWQREDPVLKNPEYGRVVEIALRVAVVCASFDHRPVLYGKDLGPAFELARYQARIRGVLKPNPGKTFEGQLYHKFFEFLTANTSNGEWIPRRELFRLTHSYEIGLPVANKTVDAMVANDDVEEIVLHGKVGRRNVSTTLRHMTAEFSEFFLVSGMVC